MKKELYDEMITVASGHSPCRDFRPRHYAVGVFETYCTGNQYKRKMRGNRKMTKLKITYTNNGKEGTIIVPLNRYNLIQAVVARFGEEIIKTESFEEIDELDKRG